MSFDCTFSELPQVSIVVIGRNEGDRLERCLESVQKMDYPASLVDVIYVDSGSTDSSVDLARRMDAKTIVLEGPTTAARGRNAGWMSVTAPFVLFLDGDTILNRDFLQIALAEFEEPRTAAVFGARREIDCEASVYNAVFDLEWCSGSGPALFFGGDALVRVEALRAVSGYNENLIAGEEPDMCRRMRGLGFTLRKIDVPMTLHDLDMHTFAQYWRRSIRTGHAYAEVASFYSRTSDPLWLCDSRKNVVRAAFWTLVPLVAFIGALVLRSWAPFLIFLCVAVLLAGRTAWKVHVRASGLRRSVAYGVHSHLQQIPIFIGQARFWLLGRSRYKTRLIEYKTLQ